MRAERPGGSRPRSSESRAVRLIDSHAPSLAATVPWIRCLCLGHICRWCIFELVGGSAGVARPRRAADCLRSDVGLLAANGGRRIRAGRRLVPGVDDLAAEVSCGNSLVWWLNVGGGADFAISRPAFVTTAV